jgi:hypothetical protein
MAAMGRISELIARLRTPQQPVGPPADRPEPPPEDGRSATSFAERAKLRRRLRFLRQTRELAFRDLGGFIFDAHRLGRSRDDIVQAKLEGLDAMDRELRALEHALDEREELRVLHEPGISVCPRCGVIHGSDANFCPGCALQRGAAPGGGPPLGPGVPRPLGEPAERSDPFAQGEQPTTESPRSGA